MSLRRACLAVGLITFLVALIAVPARATYGARTSVDEPQYLLTALSLVDDSDLDISDELEDRAYEPFHRPRLDQQTTPIDHGKRRFSPHDPLLPVLLVPGMALGGWVGAKVTLALLLGATTALMCWVGHRRFGLTRRSAVVVATGFGASAPLVAYGTQVYPEVPAALALLVLVAAATEARPSNIGLLTVVAACVALPWLSVKFVPVAAVATVAALWRRRDRTGELLAAAILLAVAGAAYLIVHQRIYGGWTAYAAGDHFVTTGEFSVVGTDPDVLGRSRRLVALLADQRFGLLPWAPIWALVPAGCALVARRRDHRLIVLAPLAAGWATATWAALTMHGWWSPGRQVVVVAPLAAIAAGHLLDRYPRLMVPAAVAAVAGATNWVWLAREASTGRRTLIVDFFETDAWPYQATEWAFAPGWPAGASNDMRLAAWAAILLASAAWASHNIGNAPRSWSDSDPDPLQFSSTEPMIGHLSER